MKKLFFITSCFAFILIILSFMYLLIIDRNPSEISSALINKEIPDFNTSTLENNNNFVSKKIFGNETMVVNFFASWCEPCKIEHFYINKLSKKGVKIIGINYKDKPKDAINWLNKLGNPYYEVALDSEGEIAINWGVYGLPETFIVNAKKIIEYRHVGPIDKNEYNDFYLKILKVKKND